MCSISLSLCDHDDILVTSLDLRVPDWIDQSITLADIAAICQGGCTSGAYMPAVTYHEAVSTMAEHGDDVLSFVEDDCGMGLSWPSGSSWSGLSCHVLSSAVELWANGIQSDAEEALPEYLRTLYGICIADGSRGVAGQCDHALLNNDIWQAFCDSQGLPDDVRRSGGLPIDWSTDDVAEALEGLSVELNGITGQLEWVDGDLFWYPEV